MHTLTISSSFCAASISSLGVPCGFWRLSCMFPMWLLSFSSSSSSLCRLNEEEQVIQCTEGSGQNPADPQAQTFLPLFGGQLSGTPAFVVFRVWCAPHAAVTSESSTEVMQWARVLEQDSAHSYPLLVGGHLQILLFITKRCLRGWLCVICWQDKQFLNDTKTILVNSCRCSSWVILKCKIILSIWVDCTHSSNMILAYQVHGLTSSWMKSITKTWKQKGANGKVQDKKLSASDKYCHTSQCIMCSSTKMKKSLAWT